MNNMQPPRPAHQKVVIHRLTVTGNIFHQVYNGSAKHFPFGFDRPLVTDEVSYERPVLKVPKEGIPLDYGWLTDKPITLVAIKNTESNKVPDLSQTIVVVINGTPCLEIPPGEAVGFTPVKNAKITLKADTLTRCSIAIIPA